MKKLTIMMVAVALLSGCTTNNAQRILSADRATYKNVGTNPAVGSTSVVDVGEIIAEEFGYGVYFDSKTVDSFVGRLFLGNVNVPAGEQLRVVEAADGSLQFCSTRNLYSDPLTGPYDIVCFADADDDLSFEKMRVPAIGGGGWKAIETPIAYQRGIVDVPVDDGTGYKMELTYQGLSDGDIKVAYREYVNNMARPAFSQIVEYEYSVGETIIAFKGARITVHDATSNNLTYTLDKGFDRYVKRVEDLSVAEETALINGLGRAGFLNSLTNCAVGRIVPPDLSVLIFDEHPAVNSRVVSADSLVVDAGPVKILALCTVESFSDKLFEELAAGTGGTTKTLFEELAAGGGQTRKKASFNFVAEAGHTYTFSMKGSDCLQLLDVTADGHVVACEPYFSGGYADLSTGDDTAIIRAGVASSDKGNCAPTTGGIRGRRDFLEVDAGPITIDGECQARILPDFFGRRRRMSSFEFVAESGHTYTITATDKECMSLLDITFEETVIACEPYRKAE